MKRLVLVVAALGACSEPADTLPQSWNTLRSRSASIDIYGVLPAGTDIVKPLSGLEGSPILEVGDDVVDATQAWWNRPSGSSAPDGAHVDAVRIAPDDGNTSVSCELTLGTLFPDPDDPSADALDAFDAAVIEARGVYPSNVIWYAGFGSGPCDVSSSASAEAWGAAIVRAVQRAPVDGVEIDSPIVAQVVRQARPTLPILRGGFRIDSLAEAASAVAQLESLAPVDIVTFSVETEDPETVADIARALRAGLDDADLRNVQLGLTGFRPTTPKTLTSPALISAHVGAWEMAARIALQDVPTVAFAISGRGTPPGVYFDATGTPTPAFMARFPIRQVEGDTRVPADDARDLRVLATVDGRVLKILVVAWDVDAGIGALDYELFVPELVPPAIREVDFRLAELDAKNRLPTSFFFTDLTTLEPDAQTGGVRIERTIPVPGVHYLELERPAF